MVAEIDRGRSASMVAIECHTKQTCIPNNWDTSERTPVNNADYFVIFSEDVKWFQISMNEDRRRPMAVSFCSHLFDFSPVLMVLFLLSRRKSIATSEPKVEVLDSLGEAQIESDNADSAKKRPRNFAHQHSWAA
ncbi:hypothetical protein AC579_3455 [Pseudocercospora musae]|uniref:Uncharacterized protein n=1 Tax=Pseudocercospora musae TaxID=113226 RepID=A0A139IE57_9PEZI|nr:hypothetical protein AC579_3455 [Pseudocercospora musae]